MKIKSAFHHKYMYSRCLYDEYIPNKKACYFRLIPSDRVGLLGITTGEDFEKKHSNKEIVISLEVGLDDGLDNYRPPIILFSYLKIIDKHGKKMATKFKKMTLCMKLYCSIREVLQYYNANSFITKYREDFMLYSKPKYKKPYPEIEFDVM